MSSPTRDSVPKLPKFLRRLHEPVPVASDEDVAAFWELQRAKGLNNWRVFMLFCGICTLLWWPTDFLLFGRTEGVTGMFAITRAVAGGMSLLLVFVTGAVPFFKRHGFETILGGGLVICFVTGWQFARLGPPDQPWIHFLHFLVLPPVAVTLKPRRRALFVALLALSTLGGYFGTHPAHLLNPLAPATFNFHIFIAIFSFMAGIAADQLRFTTFILHRTTTRQAHELRLLKEDLERRVDERTQEVRHLSAHLETARETERLHLARELHDELGQELTALRYAVELAVRRYGTDPTSIQPNLADLAALVQRTRIATRDLVTELRPRVLDELGFVAAAEALVRRTRERSGIDIDYAAPGDVALTSEVATAGYRILQECITNAIRHGSPSRLDVSLRRDPESLVVTVRDDGSGFDRSKVKSGYGLLGMRERAAANGISLLVESAPGQGTRVEARLPVAAERAEPEVAKDMVSAA